MFRQHINADGQLYFHSSCPGGSHYLLLDEISKNLHKHGHEVRMLLQLGNPVLTGNLCKHKQTCICVCIQCTEFFLMLCLLVFMLYCVHISGFSYASQASSYQTTTWSLGEKYIKEYNDWFLEQQAQFLLGRYLRV